MKINIPAIQGYLGNIVYYTTNLTFEQVSKLVCKITNEIHKSTTLKEEIQRSLSKNYVRIKDYILAHEDHFFNSLVLAVYNGEPIWTEVKYEINDEVFPNVGFLSFNGNEIIFPIDGQHRVEGIRAALKENMSLREKTIPVMLIGHEVSAQGMEKSRRIFSTLNRYAKPVLLGDIIALDEDDAIAIVTRELLEDYPLFLNDRIKAGNNKSIPHSDKKAFTSLMTLYSCHFELYKAFGFSLNISDSKVKESLKVRPSDNILLEFKNFISSFWDLFILTFPELGTFINDNSNSAASEFRSQENGGNIIFRPITLYPLIQAIIRIHKKNDVSFEKIFTKYRELNREVSSNLWNKVIWNPNTNKMIVKNQTAVKLLLLYVYDPSVLTIKEKKDLIDRYALLQGIPQNAVEEYLEQFRL